MDFMKRRVRSRGYWFGVAWGIGFILLGCAPQPEGPPEPCWIVSENCGGDEQRFYFVGMIKIGEKQDSESLIRFGTIVAHSRYAFALVSEIEQAQLIEIKCKKNKNEDMCTENYTRLLRTRTKASVTPRQFSLEDTFREGSRFYVRISIPAETFKKNLRDIKEILNL